MKITRKDLLLALSVFAIISIFVYFTMRATLLYFSHYGGLEKLFALLLIAGEAFVLMHGLGYVLNILKIFVRGHRAQQAFSLQDEPPVAI
ncbi:MAG: hypothetical protein PHG31_01915, partial [Candidatus Omnitrophica bacterium]|nr:hypothetical protein [Candidatus Omnitrophota bacterium]